MSKGEKNIYKYLLIAVLGGSGTMGAAKWVSMLWKPYVEINGKRMEEMVESKNLLMDVNFNLRVLQFQREGHSLDKAIEQANKE